MKEIPLSATTPHWKIRLLSLMFTKQNSEKIITFRWNKGRIISQDDTKFYFKSSGLVDAGEIVFYGTE
jgi:hypothetical protein